MTAFHDYRDLLAWQRAMSWIGGVYGVAKQLPSTERFGLASQLQRAAVSVPANIAEGHARSGSREFLHHLSIALGSLAEVETLLMVAANLGYVSQACVDPLLDDAAEIGRMTRGLQNAIRRRITNS